MDCIEKRIIDEIDAHKDEIIAFGRDIWRHGELGYKECRTSEKFAACMEMLHLKTQRNLAVTGVKSYLKDGGVNGPVIALMGEMDALPIPEHKDADPITGAAHCCGHHAQITGLIGAAYALSIPEVKAALDGNVIFFAVPSEEYVDIEYKEKLIQEGSITFGGGKAELLSIGAMDDLDAVIGSHAFPDKGIGILNSSMNGFVNKIVKYTGKAAHAASEPEKGINALNAATVMMHAIDAQRETFKDSDSVRIHGFFSDGGKAMNIITDTVTMEYSIRAKNMSAIEDASRKFDRAVRAGAVALGCNVEISTIPGYWPVIPSVDTKALESAIDIASQDYPIKHITSDCHETASSDYGEVSHVLPLCQFYTGGLSGTMHTPDLFVEDEELVYIISAKIYALSAYQYLKEGAVYAKELIEKYRPVLDRDTLIKNYKKIRKNEFITEMQ